MTRTCAGCRRPFDQDPRPGRPYRYCDECRPKRAPHRPAAGVRPVRVRRPSAAKVDPDDAAFTLADFAAARGYDPCTRRYA